MAWLKSITWFLILLAVIHYPITASSSPAASASASSVFSSPYMAKLFMQCLSKGVTSSPAIPNEVQDDINSIASVILSGITSSKLGKSNARASAFSAAFESSIAELVILDHLDLAAFSRIVSNCFLGTTGNSNTDFITNIQRLIGTFSGVNQSQASAVDSASAASSTAAASDAISGYDYVDYETAAAAAAATASTAAPANSATFVSGANGLHKYVQGYQTPSAAEGTADSVSGVNRLTYYSPGYSTIAVPSKVTASSAIATAVDQSLTNSFTSSSAFEKAIQSVTSATDLGRFGYSLGYMAANYLGISDANDCANEFAQAFRAVGSGANTYAYAEAIASVIGKLYDFRGWSATDVTAFATALARASSTAYELSGAAYAVTVAAAASSAGTASGAYGRYGYDDNGSAIAAAVAPTGDKVRNKYGRFYGTDSEATAAAAEVAASSSATASRANVNKYARGYQVATAASSAATSSAASASKTSINYPGRFLSPAASSRSIVSSFASALISGNGLSAEIISNTLSFLASRFRGSGLDSQASLMEASVEMISILSQILNKSKISSLNI